MNGPPHSAIEYRRYGKEDNDTEGPLVYHRAPLVPAAKYLRTLIGCYLSLDRVPLMDPYHSDPDFAKDEHRESLNWYFENVRTVCSSSSLKYLLKQCVDAR